MNLNFLSILPWYSLSIWYYNNTALGWLLFMVMVNGNLVLTIPCVTELQLLLLICSFIFNYQKLNILSTSQCKFWTWTKTCERNINFSLLAWQMFSCSAPALLLLHWRLFWFHFLLKLLLFMGKRNVVSLLYLFLLKKDQMRSDQWSVYKFI